MTNPLLRRSLAWPAQAAEPDVDEHVRESGTRLVSSPRLQAAGATDIGRQRETNEDALTVRPDLGLLVVCDGIGGAAAGDVASKTAVDAVRACIETPNGRWPVGMQSPQWGGAALLAAAVQRANHHVFVTAQEDRALHGMGTTIVAALVMDNRCAVAWVGDSRAYLLRDGHFAQLTEDHSVIAEGARAGLWSVDSPEALVYANQIARWLGSAMVQVEQRVIEVHAGDVLLLCSDGLTNELDDDVLAGVLADVADPAEAVQSLIQRANDNGGSDNITAIVARWT
jgi:serine/threonine protein phosphatase PrpC